MAEHGSFTAAAEASGSSKANLSQHVTELEAALGVQLLYRTTRRLRLTEVGEGYLERAKRAVSQLNTAAEWAGQATGELKGVIRVNTVGGPIGEELLAPLIIEFQKHYPGVNVHLDFSSVRVDLIEDRYDLVVRMGELPDSTLIASKLLDITTLYVAAPELLEQYGPIDQPEDLLNLPLVYGSVDHWLLKRGDEQRMVPVAGKGTRMVSGRVMRNAAVAGLGATRVGDVYVQSDIRDGRLIQILPEWSETTSLSLVCPPLRHQLARVRALMDWLKARAPQAYAELLPSR
ncbi:MAG: LysR family transcriptional regulator [Pseudomonadota bacterium]|nr:LysR family transcriptional regulator [Pseudomonadota bacterium]